MNNHDSKLEYQPLLLLRNISYPTYQLYATAGRGQVSPENVLTIAILETIKWLRKRFRDFELPAELDLPNPENYCDFDVKNFKSFQIDVGYKVEVIWLNEEKIWTLQLTEPDLGIHHGKAKQGRLPVPGRIFETNIAYRVLDNQVECGFQTMVSEPKGTKEPCEVMRLAFIKHLARNANVKLFQEKQLIDSYDMIDNPHKIKSLFSW